MSSDRLGDLRGRRVLVTGAGGFVGANLTRELLQRGADVHALVRPSTRLWRVAEIIPRLTLHLVDLSHREEIEKTVIAARPKVIFHLARDRGDRSKQDRFETLGLNILGTANLLEATASLDYERFVYTGSLLEYGVRKEPLKESDLLEPLTVYGVTKAAETLLCQQFARAHRRPVVVLRPVTVYGPWEAPTRLVPTAIRAALCNQEITLTVPGYRRDWLFVGDLVEACLLTLQAKNVAGEIINIGSGQQWANEEVVQMVETVSGERVKVRVGEYPPRPFDTSHWVADIRKAKSLLGWEPQHSLRSGLEKTIAWFRLHQDAYERRSRD